MDHQFTEDSSDDTRFKSKSSLPCISSEKSLIPATPENNNSNNNGNINATKLHNQYPHSLGSVPATPCRGKRSSLSSSHSLNANSPRHTLISHASESADLQSPVKLSRLPWTWEMCQPAKNHLAGVSLPASHSLPSDSPLSFSQGGARGGFLKPSASGNGGANGFGGMLLPSAASAHSDAWSPLSQSPPSPSATLIIPATPGRHRRFGRKGMPVRGDSGLDYLPSPLKERNHGGGIVSSGCVGGVTAAAASGWPKDGATGSPRCVISATSGGAGRSTPRKASAAAAEGGKGGAAGGGGGGGKIEGNRGGRGVLGGGSGAGEEDVVMVNTSGEEASDEGDGGREVSLEKLQRLRSGMRESLVDASCFFPLDTDVMADVTSPQKRTRTTASPRGSGTMPLQAIPERSRGDEALHSPHPDAWKSLSAKKERGHGHLSGVNATVMASTPDAGAKTAVSSATAIGAAPSLSLGFGEYSMDLSYPKQSPAGSASPVLPRPAASFMSEDVNQICEDMDLGEDSKKQRGGEAEEDGEDIARSVDSWKFLVASMFVEKDSSQRVRDFCTYTGMFLSLMSRTSPPMTFSNLHIGPSLALTDASVSFVFSFSLILVLPTQMQELVVSLLDYIPSAEAATAVTTTDLQAAMKSLGMPSDDAQAVIQLSADFKEKAWSSVSEISHVSK